MGRRVLTWFVVPAAATAAAGLLAGLIWQLVAPRALLQEVGAGAAQVVNAETRAFIGADGWFCVIAAIAGVLTGVAGYLAGIRRRDPARAGAVTAGLIGGAVAASFLMRWTGEQPGRAAYVSALAHSPTGTMFHATLALGAVSALAFWPLFTSVVIVIAEVGRHRQESGPEPGPLPAVWSGPQGGDGAA